jgi:glutamate-ammonia-ligase adenylyltransferase
MLTIFDYNRLNMSLTTLQNSANLFGQEPLNEEQIRPWLVPVGFADWQAAYRCLQRIAKEPPMQQALADSLPQLLLALADTANPDQVLVSFERFVYNSTNQFELFHDFAGNPRTFQILFTLFEGSQFLTEILLRQPEYFERLVAHHRLAQPKSAQQFQTEARAIISHLASLQNETDITAALDALRRFQRWELLRIGTADLLGSFDLPTVTSQLSYLADSLVGACLILAAQKVKIDPANFFVVALGKLGGEELNYSSDIDLLFLASAEPMAYRQLGQRLIDNLTRITAEGFLYRVDMRLRPWGSTGPLISSLDGYIAYTQKHARLWEKQALLKARLVAGNPKLGQKFLQQIQPFLFNAPPETIRTEVSALKQRIETQLRQRGQEWGEVKLGQGSIRDIEFVTQYLQLVHGGKHPELRNYNTLRALNQLFAGKFLSPDEYHVLTNGYVFLRTIEHHLQLMHYRQTHALPGDEEALNHLAWRLGFQGTNVGRRFVDRYHQHSAVIRLVYQQQLGQENGANTNDVSTLSKPTEPPSPHLLPHMARMRADYLAAFTETQIRRHARLAEELSYEMPIKVEATPHDDYWQVTVVGYDYLGELSVICGLLFVYGFNILNGQVFSYEATPETPVTAAKDRPARSRHRQTRAKTADSRPKIVDVFTMRSISGQLVPECWANYTKDLTTLVRRLQAGQQREVQGELAKRVAVALHQITPASTTLYPIDIEIDNDASRQYTVLRIDAPDTFGFLYELSNALALSNINIGRVVVETVGNRVRDVLYVTDAQGRKIVAQDKQTELRAAIALIKQFTHLLPNSPNPESALFHFREFIGQLFSQPNWPDDLVSLRRPEVLTILARLLGVSDFLWDDFLRMQHGNLFPILQNVEVLAARKPKSKLWQELETILQAVLPGQAQRDALNVFKDREMFRTDMRQIQGHIKEFGEFSGELTDLAEVVVEAAYHICVRELQAQYGLPYLDQRPCSLTICALGKSGGRELGFASDIELMFIYEGNGRTRGSRSISNAEFYDRLVHDVGDTIKTRREGIFEVDLRLRPYGKAGSLAVSLGAFRRYFAPGGDAWPYERQMLVKLRPIAGDVRLGQQILALRDEFIYNGQLFDVAAMRAMRERQIRHGVTAGTINAKLSPGGLVDIEYLVQGLQITHGYHNPGLRLTNTREAMRALAIAGILSPEDYTPLSQALNFLRNLINALRMVRGNARDLTVPSPDDDEFAFLARRLNYSRENPAQLQDDLIRHTTFVQEINTRLLS